MEIAWRKEQFLMEQSENSQMILAEISQYLWAQIFSAVQDCSVLQTFALEIIFLLMLLHVKTGNAIQVIPGYAEIELNRRHLLYFHINNTEDCSRINWNSCVVCMWYMNYREVQLTNMSWQRRIETNMNNTTLLKWILHMIFAWK